MAKVIGHHPFSPEGGVLILPTQAVPNTVGGKTYTPSAHYASSSNQNKRYTVCEVNDGTLSCDCMGWTRRNPPGGRTCKHTQDYEGHLRRTWSQMNSGTMPTPVGDKVYDNDDPEPETSRPKRPRGRERGGSLSDLFKKLDKEVTRGN